MWALEIVLWFAKVLGATAVRCEGAVVTLVGPAERERTAPHSIILGMMLYEILWESEP